MAWLQHAGHWIQQAFTTLRGLSLVSILAIAAIAYVALRLLSGLLRVVVRVELVVAGGYVLLHVVLHAF